MTIQQITEKLQKKIYTEDERLQFAAIVKTSVTEMNVDGLLKEVLSIKWYMRVHHTYHLLLVKIKINVNDILSAFSALCKKIVADVQDSCMNLNCPSGNGKMTPLNTVNFNIKINLKDDTGYLIGCRLTGDIAERVLGCTVDEFQVIYFTHWQ